MLGLKVAGLAEMGSDLIVGSPVPLAASDLTLLAAGLPRVAPAPLARLRARHHGLAKSLAEGMRPGVAAAIHGYSASRVSILQGDPAFKELIAHYQNERDSDFARVAERLTGLAVAAMDELAERLEESPEKIKNGELMKLTAIAADRIGHGPKAQTDVNVFVKFGDRLRAAQERLNAAKVIEGTAIAAE